MKRFTQLAGLCLGLFLFFSTLPTPLNAQSNIAKRIRASNGDTIPFLQYTPPGHNVPGNTRTYPLIVFLHGIGQCSDNSSIAAGAPVWNIQGSGGTTGAYDGWGPSRLIRLGNYMNFTWNGQTDTFIVLSPMSRATDRFDHHSLVEWPGIYTTAILNYARDSLKIDTNRIYLTGLSFGGGGTFNFLCLNAANPKRLAAAAPICAPFGPFDQWGLLPNGPQWVGEAKLPVWGFHAQDDPTANVSGTIVPVDSINNHIPAPAVKALKTIWPSGGHEIWIREYNIDTYPYSYDGIVNIYEWFLGQDKSKPTNVLPVARAGNDTTISRSIGIVTLNGSASTDADGSVVRYVWKKFSGPARGTIATPLGPASSTTVSGLDTIGVYKYELIVVDDRAAIARDTIFITVDSSTVLGKAVAITSTGRISTGDVTALKNASKFTLEAWFEYDSTVSTWTTLMCKSTSLSDRVMLHIGPSNNSIYVMVCNGANTYGYTGANAVSPATWYHVAAVFDGTQTGNANRLKLYIDGIQQTLSFNDTIPASTSSTNTAAFRAGGEFSCCGLNGTIDEVRVWNTALSASTISAWKDKLLGTCHPKIANLSLYWPLDNNSNPAQATAALGTAYTGTITNGSYVSSAQATDSACTGKAATISSGGRIFTGDVTQLDNVSKFTLEARFKYDSTVGTWTTLIRKSTTQTDRIMLHIGPGDNAVYAMVGNGNDTYGATPAGAVSPGTWYHVAAVFDGTQTGNANRLKIYIDGVQQTLTFTGTIPANTSSTNTASFMAGGEPTCCHLNGTLDEMRVWNAALSSATIDAWKDRSLGNCHSDYANLVLYWPLDNNSNPAQATAGLSTTYTGTIINGSYVSSAQATTTSGCIGGSFVAARPLEVVQMNILSTTRIYPNPTDGLVQIELTAPASTLVTVNVVNMYGKYVYRNKKPLVTGTNRISLNIASLPSGTYIIEVGDGKTILEKHKVVKL